jgi:hypothetical protein
MPRVHAAAKTGRVAAKFTVCDFNGHVQVAHPAAIGVLVGIGRGVVAERTITDDIVACSLNIPPPLLTPELFTARASLFENVQ